MKTHLLGAIVLSQIAVIQSFASGSRAVSTEEELEAPTQIATILTGDGFSQWWQGSRGLTNWSGNRIKFENAGVKFFGSYEQDLAGNPIGGLDQGITNSGSIEFGALFNLEKLADWKSTSLLVRFVDRNGSDLSKQYIGNFFPVQQDFGSETIMLQSVAFEKKFADDAFSVKFGHIAMGDDFAESPIYGHYLSNSIDGTPKALTTTLAFSCYPGSVWGARLSYKSPSKQWYAKAGLYQANDRLYENRYHGFNFDFREKDGLTAIAEVGWTPEFCKQRVNLPDGSLKSVGMPGHYKLGTYTSWWEIPRFDGNGHEDFSCAFYVHGDQMVFQPNADAGTDKGLTVWAFLVFAPEQSVQAVPFQVSTGALYKGLIPSRANDHVIFGFTYGNFSSDYAQQQQTITNVAPTGETVFELGYAAQLNKFINLQPNVQYIVNPAGNSRIDDAVALGLRLRIIL